eukprot:TRINITY_DN773093_c0_g1_i1.p1 TRINITY_DN773093_c0_g1~~TRINITY_DN773093_c0_g1_i1.p1  ORF type:complete len:434 (+),score=106.15 TRINITY_DN773093_c0_g1_i1:65-1366(+)
MYPSQAPGFSIYNDENVRPVEASSRHVSTKPLNMKTAPLKSHRRPLGEITNTNAGIIGKKLTTSSKLDGSSKVDNIFESDSFFLNAFHAPPVASIRDVDREVKNKGEFATDFIDDIMDYKFDLEERRYVKPSYMAKQPQITSEMRSILIDWLADVSYKYELMPQTLYLTTHFLDRFLCKKGVHKKKFQLVGATAIFVASKYEETRAPEVQDFVYATDYIVTKEEIFRMETLLCQCLQFKLDHATALFFAKRFLRAIPDDIYVLQNEYECVNDDNIDDGPNNGIKPEAEFRAPSHDRSTNDIFDVSDMAPSDIASISKRVAQCKQFAYYCCERTLQEYQFLHFLPSIIAASAVSLAMEVMGYEPWNPALTKIAQITQAEASSCIQMLRALMQHVPNGKLRTIYRKYRNPAFHEVALLSVPGKVDPEVAKSYNFI